MTILLENTYGYIKEDKVFVKAFREFPDREIGVVKETPEKSLQYFINRFEMVEEKVDTLISNVNEAINKGSYLMKLLHMKEYVINYNAIGDFNLLLQKLEFLESELNKLIENNRLRNLQHKIDIVEKAKELSNSTDWKETTYQFKELQTKWIKIGRVSHEKEEEINQDFDRYVKGFFARRDHFYETKRLVFEDRYKQYIDIIQRAERFLNEEDSESVSNQFNDLHQEWKTVGQIQRDKQAELWEKFKDKSDLFYKKLNFQNKKKKTIKSLSVRDKLNMKKMLCDKAEKLLNVDLISAINKAKELQKDWKKIGWLNLNEEKELESKFWLTCDYLFELNYLEGLLVKKVRNWEQLTEIEKEKKRKGMLHELIKRDQEQLAVYEENVGKFTISEQKSDLNKVLKSKFQNQKRKLAAKKIILQSLETKSATA